MSWKYDLLLFGIELERVRERERRRISLLLIWLFLGFSCGIIDDCRFDMFDLLRFIFDSISKINNIYFLNE